MDCEVGGYDEHEKGRMAILVILGKRSEGIHEFISRRPIPLALHGFIGPGRADISHYLDVLDSCNSLT